jgi:prophage regulatory protein
MTNTFHFIRLPDVLKATGLSRSTIYAMVRQGRFPTPIKLSLSAIGWQVSEIEKWAQERIQSATEYRNDNAG